MGTISPKAKGNNELMRVHARGIYLQTSKVRPGTVCPMSRKIVFTFKKATALPSFKTNLFCQEGKLQLGCANCSGESTSTED